jgi:ribosomal protein S4
MRLCRTLIAALVLLVVPAAFAASASHQLTLNKNVAVNGKEIKSGDYKLKWDGTGDNVDVSFTRGKQVLATSPAHVVALDRPSDQDTLVYHDNADGTRSLTEIRFGGKKFAIVLGEQAASTSMAAGQSSGTTTK